LRAGANSPVALPICPLRTVTIATVNSETIGFHVLSVISECVIYCLTGENLDHPFTQFAVRLPSRTRLACFVTHHVLEALQREVIGPEISNP
jgi:hypothetical protein